MLLPAPFFKYGCKAVQGELVLPWGWDCAPAVKRRGSQDRFGGKLVNTLNGRVGVTWWPLSRGVAPGFLT